MRLSDIFHQEILALLESVKTNNREILHILGKVVGKSLAEGGVLHVFGSGHSGIVAQEIIHRAGGLVPISAIVDPCGGWPEIVPGYGHKLIQRYAYNFGLESGETIIVISNSGRNPCPIEIACESRERGLNVVALTSLEMSERSTSNHPSGKRLFEVADYVLDNGGIMGDARIALSHRSHKVGPTSTMSGAHLLNLLALEAVGFLEKESLPIPIYRSANIPGSREYNAEIAEKYKHRLSRPL